MRKYDIVMKYHDRSYHCDAEMKVEDCTKSPFSESYQENLADFEHDLGEIESITIKFKK